MPDVLFGLKILVATFAVLTVLMNMDPKIPRFPWDMIIDRFGFLIYLPLITSLVVAIVISILMTALKS